jgi:hypothetical protein
VSGRRFLRLGMWTLQLGHSFLPSLRHFWMHSPQKRCRHSITIVVLFIYPRQIGHWNNVSNEFILSRSGSLGMGRFLGLRWTSYIVKPGMTVSSSYLEWGLYSSPSSGSCIFESLDVDLSLSSNSTLLALALEAFG